MFLENFNDQENHKPVGTKFKCIFESRKHQKHVMLFKKEFENY